MHPSSLVSTTSPLYPPILTYANAIPQIKDASVAIHEFVVAHKELFCNEASKYGYDIFIRPCESGLPRALQFTQTHRVIVHLNRAKCGDEIIGLGFAKRIVLAVDLESLKYFASASFKQTDDVEIKFLMKFKGVPGFAQMHHRVQYAKEKPIISEKNTLSMQRNTALIGIFKIKIKQRILLDLYEEGDLFNKIHRGISFRDKEKIFNDLIGALLFLHNNGYLHRDIKPENIFLGKTNEEESLHAFLGDFGFTCKTTDEEQKRKAVGSPHYISPEYAQALQTSHKNPNIINLVTTEARDVWSLGLTLAITLNFFIPPWMKIEFSDEEGPQLLQMISNYTELPEPSKNSPEHIIWRMLKKDPRERISANEAAENLSLIEWS